MCDIRDVAYFFLTANLHLYFQKNSLYSQKNYNISFQDKNDVDNK